jgi:four helix bundle protein
LGIVIKWDSFPRGTVGVQYVNASDSVGANIAEGYGKGSFADRSRFAKKLITDQEFTEINNILEMLLPKLSSYINYLNE